MTRIEGNQETEDMQEHDEYLKGRHKEIEEKRIEGYLRQIKLFATYEKLNATYPFTLPFLIVGGSNS